MRSYNNRIDHDDSLILNSNIACEIFIDVGNNHFYLVQKNVRHLYLERKHYYNRD